MRSAVSALHAMKRDDDARRLFGLLVETFPDMQKEDFDTLVSTVKWYSGTIEREILKTDEEAPTGPTSQRRETERGRSRRE